MDVECFAQKWKEIKNDKKSYKRGNKAMWDRRVEEFNHDGPDERLEKITGLLREKQMLNPNSTVLDIGCGPGKFVIAFAQTAKNVTGVDISPNMLQSATENAAAASMENTDFKELDWEKVNLADLPWGKKFSLVTAIMSPVPDSKESLDKMLEASSEYGLISRFVERYESIGDELKKNILSRHRVDKYGNIGIYCGFNILWHYKLFPEIAYFDTYRERTRTLAEANLHYIKRLEIKEKLTPAQKEEVLLFLKSKAENGIVTEKITGKIACLYWKSK